MTLPLQLRDYLENQLRYPFEETLIDGLRKVEVMKPFSWRNQEYQPADPRRWPAPGDMLEAPASTVKGWYKEGKVRLLTDGSRESGPWDHFKIGSARLDGFQPWKDPNPEEDRRDIPRLPPSEFDFCWCPVIKRFGDGMSGFGWSSPFFLPFSLVQKCALKGDENWEENSIVLDLPWEVASMRARLVSA